MPVSCEHDGILAQGKAAGYIILIFIPFLLFYSKDEFNFVRCKGCVDQLSIATNCTRSENMATSNCWQTLEAMDKMPQPTKHSKATFEWDLFF